MKRKICYSILVIFGITSAYAQHTENTISRQWTFDPELNFYFIPDDFFVIPIFSADKNKLHLEARYNYEDMETFSLWGGYNFSGGKSFTYIITPMAGGVFGRTNGVTAGGEITLSYKRLELYTETEYLFDLDSEENNFFYNWTDLVFSPNEKFWFGISAQRTQLYETDLDLQRGLLLGFAVRKLDVTAYWYNIANDDAFVVISLSMGF
jgi:hypothetical protein